MSIPQRLYASHRPPKCLSGMNPLVARYWLCVSLYVAHLCWGIIAPHSMAWLVFVQPWTYFAKRYVSSVITLWVLADSPSLSSFFPCQALRITQNPPIITTRYPLQPHIYSWHATCSQCSWFVPTTRVIHLKCSRFVLPWCLIFSHTFVTFFTLLWSRWFFSCQGVDKRWDPGNSGVWWFGGLVDALESKTKEISQRHYSNTPIAPYDIPYRNTQERGGEAFLPQVSTDW